jgi:hypothetical protein
LGDEENIKNGDNEVKAYVGIVSYLPRQVERQQFCQKIQLKPLLYAEYGPYASCGNINGIVSENALAGEIKMVK